MELRFECPHCGQHVSATPDQIGHSAPCPNCSTVIIVPNPLASAVPPPWPQQPPPTPTTAGSEQPKQGGSKKVFRTLAAGCAGLFILVVGLIVLIAIFSSSSDRPHPATAGQTSASASFSRKPVDAPPIEFATASNVDERLFLLRLLEEMYSEWPTDVSQPQELQKALGELRHRANRHYLDVKQRKLDDTLLSLYADFISAVDSYIGFLANIGKIESDAVARAEKESAESGFNAGFAGGATAADAYNNGSSGSDSLLAGAAVGVVSYLWDDYNKGKARDAAKQRAVEASVQELQNKLSTYVARSQNAALELAQRYSWDRGEAGFDDPPQQAVTIRNLVKANDISGLLQLTDAAQRRRPRDPFALSRRAYLSSLDGGRTPKDLVATANQCLAAALVPAGRIYDEYRGWFLYTAGDIANRASTREIGNNSWACAYNATAAYAIRLWDECLKYAPQDATGEFAERRAWALVQSGHLKEALDQAISVQPLRGNTLRYAYNLSCLLSALGDTENAFKWFDHAVRNLGYNNIAQARTDPDLEAMRNLKKPQFDDLTAVRWSWSIDFGVFNDDVIVKNDSAFPITNVVFKGSLNANGRSWTPELKTPQIAPGQTYKWANVISIPGSKLDQSSSASLTADQNR